ncbi:heme NO-binding domain-containing protein [bacterium]|nr:heme NO-binding domain-containing protein [bacterium]
MKGIIFTVFNKLVEEKFGLETWDKLILAVKPKSKGAYTTAATYEDSELFSLVGELASTTKIPTTKLIKTFGSYTLLTLSKIYPAFFEGKTLKEFLTSIDQIVHVEVKKLYPDAGLPKFNYENPSPNELVMNYESPRKLCVLAEGLIEGAAHYYKNKITINHPLCMHKGAHHCRLEIKIGD